jgi:hypothetical protein
MRYRPPRRPAESFVAQKVLAKTDEDAIDPKPASGGFPKPQQAKESLFILHAGGGLE